MSISSLTPLPTNTRSGEAYGVPRATWWAAIASRVSAAPMSDTSAMTAPVAGLVTGKLFPESAARHAPFT